MILPARVIPVALSIVLAGCGGASDAAVLGVDAADCQPVRSGAMVGFTLRDAPPLHDGRRYRCVVFPGTARRSVQVTVFADGFQPTVVLLDPAEAQRRVLARGRSGPGTDMTQASVVLPRTSPYAAVVTAQSGETGTFLISVQDNP